MRSTRRMSQENAKEQAKVDINDIAREMKTAPVDIQVELDNLRGQLRLLYQAAHQASENKRLNDAGIAAYHAGCKAVLELIQDHPKAKRNSTEFQKDYKELHKIIIDASRAIRDKNTGKMEESVKVLNADVTKFSRKAPWKRLKKFTNFFKGGQQKSQPGEFVKSLRHLATVVAEPLDKSAKILASVKSLITNPLDTALADTIFNSTTQDRELRATIIDFASKLSSDDLFKLTNAIMEAHKRLGVEEFYPLRSPVLSSDLYSLCAANSQYTTRTTEPENMTQLNLCVYDMMVEKNRLDPISVTNPFDATVEGIGFKLKSDKIKAASTNLADAMKMKKDDSIDGVVNNRVKPNLEKALAERKKLQGSHHIH